MPSPKYLAAALILFASCCFYGCDNTIEMANPTLDLGSVEVTGSISRGSYDWPVGSKFFEPETPSRFKFFDATRERVKAFLDQDPLKEQPKELFFPEGFSQKMNNLAHLVKLPRDESNVFLKVPVSSDSAVVCNLAKRGQSRDL